MVMDLFSLGSLNDYLYPGTPKFKALSWQLRVRIALDIARAMEYLHAEDVIHRDLRSPNVLVNSFAEDADQVVKVGDLGMSVVSFS
jgi:serine/threonine protein kinase